jgi:hypothetical protein
MGSTLMAAILLGLGWSSMGGKPARRRPSRTGYTAPSGSDVVGDVVDVYGDVVDTVAETVVNTGKTIIDWFEDIIDDTRDWIDDTIIDPYTLNIPDPQDLPGPPPPGTEGPLTVIDTYTDEDVPYIPPSDIPISTLYYPYNEGYEGVYSEPAGGGTPFNAHDYIGVQGGDDRSGTVDYSQESLLDYAWRAGTDWFTNLRGLW